MKYENKKECIKALKDLGFLAYIVHEAPENSFWGNQGELVVTEKGREEGIHLFRCSRRDDDVWPGEVIPLHRISQGEEVLWED